MALKNRLGCSRMNLKSRCIVKVSLVPYAARLFTQSTIVRSITFIHSLREVRPYQEMLSSLIVSAIGRKERVLEVLVAQSESGKAQLHYSV
jgi:hypothetical protein